MNKKPSLKEDIFKQILYKELSKLNSVAGSKSNFYEFIRTKYRCTRQTCLRWHDKYYPEYQKNRLNRIVDTTIDGEAEAIKAGLKSKYDRVLELQRQVDAMKSELDNNSTVVSVFHNGELYTDKRPLSSLEKSRLHQVIKELRAEISKIEGDYAPTKSTVTIDGADSIFIEKK